MSERLLIQVLARLCVVRVLRRLGGGGGDGGHFVVLHGIWRTCWTMVTVFMNCGYKIFSSCGY